MNRLRIFGVFIFVFLFLGHANSQSAGYDKITKHYTKLIKKKKVVGASIAIIDADEVVFSQGFGYSDLENKVKADSKTVYRIGSSSKIFTAIAVLQLHEKGLININESIKKYIPELTINNLGQDGNEIVIKDIMSHSSGLPSDIMNGFLGYEVKDISWTIVELNKHQTISPQKYISAYSNVGYALLGELIARVSGVSYEEYVSHNIFEPLEMKNSSFRLDSDLLSKGYIKKRAIKLAFVRDFAAGSILSNVDDMTRFVRMMLNDGLYKNVQILSKESISDIKANHLADNSVKVSDQYGYALTRYPVIAKEGEEEKEILLYKHGGDIVAFHADFGFIPELNVGAVILTNTQSGSRIRNTRKVMETYLKEVKGIELSIADLEQQEIGKPFSDADILGSYNLGFGFTTIENVDKFKLNIQGQKIVFKRIGKTNAYSLKAILFGFIPIKIKSIEMHLERIGDEIFMRQIQKGSNEWSYIAKKVKKSAIPRRWKSKFGHYKVVNNINSCTDCIADFEGARLELMEKDGFLVMKITSDIKTILLGEYYLNVVSDDVATLGGVGRNSGLTVRVLENGNVYFSGFEFGR